MERRLIEVCRTAGKKIPLWVQGPGGNISVKDGNTLWIKGSGFRLDGVGPGEGIAELDLEALRNTLKAISPEEETAYAEGIHAASGTGCRASMESGFHALLPGKWVIHIHSLASLLMAFHLRRHPDRTENWLSSRMKFHHLAPVLPGLRLSLAIATDPDKDVYLLENHGVILQGDGAPAKLLSGWHQLEKDFCAAFGFRLLGDFLELEDPLPECRKWLERQSASPMNLYFPDSAVFLERLKTVVLEEGGSLVKFNPEGWLRDADASELWLATRILYECDRSLPALPEKIANTVGVLPTEIARKSTA